MPPSVIVIAGGVVPGWNPYLGEDTAAHYAHARPNHHPEAVAVAVRLLSLSVPVGLAVDVGCGTGMSARALRAVAGTVVGLDISAPMLRAAAPLPGVHYLRATAERLPLATGAADLVTASAAFHWFDHAAVLAETARILTADGALVVYTDFFDGHLAGAPECSAWLMDTYRTRFPAPPERRDFDADTATAAGLRLVGLRLVGTEELTHDVPMTPDTLTDYLLSQRYATSAIDSGHTTREELRDWLLTGIRPRLPTGPAAARFTGTVWCCRRVHPAGSAR